MSSLSSLQLLSHDQLNVVKANTKPFEDKKDMIQRLLAFHTLQLPAPKPFHPPKDQADRKQKMLQKADELYEQFHTLQDKIQSQQLESLYKTLEQNM